MKKKVLIASDSLKIQRQAASCFNPEVYDLIFSQGAHDTLMKLERMRPEFLFFDQDLQDLTHHQLSEALSRSRTLDLFWFGEKSGFSFSSSCRFHWVAKPFRAKTLLEVLMSVTEEESTPVKSLSGEESISDEVTRKSKIDDNSSGPFSSFRKVVGVGEPNHEEEITAKIKPQLFQRPVNAPASDSEPLKRQDNLQNRDPVDVAHQKIEEWIESHLPSLAERLIKEEIAKRFYS